MLRFFLCKDIPDIKHIRHINNIHGINNLLSPQAKKSGQEPQIGRLS